MPETLSQQHQRLVAQRDRLAIAAIEAAAHQLPIAPDLAQMQRRLEDDLESALPFNVWQELFPTWVMQDLTAAAQPYHARVRPVPGCTLCRSTAKPTLPLRLLRSA